MSLAAQMQQRQEVNALKLKEAKKSAASTKSIKWNQWKINILINSNSSSEQFHVKACQLPAVKCTKLSPSAVA